MISFYIDDAGYFGGNGLKLTTYKGNTFSNYIAENLCESDCGCIPEHYFDYGIAPTTHSTISSNEDYIVALSEIPDDTLYPDNVFIFHVTNSSLIGYLIENTIGASDYVKCTDTIIDGATYYVVDQRSR